MTNLGMKLRTMFLREEFARPLAAIAVVGVCFAGAGAARAQVMVDKMVATVNSGVRTDLITYSDLLWQMALEPGAPLTNPSSEELNATLRLVIDQRLLAQEAEKLPTIAPTDEEVNAALDDLIKRFPPGQFAERASLVGFSSVSDERLREIIRQRVAIEKYLNFRFRSFTVVTPQEVTGYYRDVYVPRLRRRAPGAIIPPLDDKLRATLEKELTESKIESDTDTFLESARTHAQIVTLSPL